MSGADRGRRVSMKATWLLLSNNTQPPHVRLVSDYLVWPLDHRVGGLRPSLNSAVTFVAARPQALLLGAIDLNDDAVLHDDVYRAESQSTQRRGDLAQFVFGRQSAAADG